MARPPSRRVTLLSTAAALAAAGIDNKSTLAFSPPASTLGRWRDHAANPAVIATTVTTSLSSSDSSTDYPPSEVIAALSSKPISLTPEGYGFSSPIERIFKLANRQNGYYKAKGTDSVVDVMEGISNMGDKMDVALVFDQNEGKENLLGIFTEGDYIRVSHSC